jgi:transcription antitermination protein NusB
MMGQRHIGRMLATQFLFQRDFNQNDFEEALALFWEAQDAQGKARNFADQLIRGVEQHRAEIDERLQSYASNWEIGRMGAIDRNVLRMALYEMFYCLDIPPVVSINEAVDIAKEFSSIQSGHFVNGILDRAKRDLKRPLRTVRPVNMPNFDWGEEED